MLMLRQFSTRRIGQSNRLADLSVVLADSSRFITPEIGDIRFTQTKDAFYILSLSPLTSNFLVSLPLPILKGDTVSMIGAGNGSVLEWDFLSSGSGINVTVPEHLITVGKYCWVLKISYIA